MITSTTIVTHKQNYSLLIALMLEAASTSETSVNFYQTTRRNNPKDSHLHTHCRENLKSHKITEHGKASYYISKRQQPELYPQLAKFGKYCVRNTVILQHNNA
jgi:hypothetical protein